MTSPALFFLRLRKIISILKRSKLRSAFVRHRVVAGVEHHAVFDRPFATVIDIGANRGQFALAARAFGCGKVYSFEPLPNASNIFRKVFVNDPAVILHMAAIGEKAEIKSIHLSARDDSSSLLEIGDAQSSFFPGTHEVGTAEVAVGTLEQFVHGEEIVRPALLKLDVQGFEFQALKGCQSLIDKFEVIYCECSFIELYKDQKLADEVILYLGSLGFGLTGIYNPYYDRAGHCIQADLLFKRLRS